MKKGSKWIALCMILAAVLMQAPLEGGIVQAKAKPQKYIEYLNGTFYDFEAVVKYETGCTYNGKYPSYLVGKKVIVGLTEAWNGLRYITDLNGDGSKELLLAYNGYYHLFTQKKGKVKYVSTFAAHNSGYGVIYYHKKTKTFALSAYEGGKMGSYTVFRYSGGKLKVVARLHEQLGDMAFREKTTYYVNNKKASKAKYKKYWKKYTKGRKMRDYLR